MSQSGFLNENELSEQIYRFFDLKLDKEAFVKPTRDVVVEIYTRFLDKSGIEWKRIRNSDNYRHEPNPLFQMLGCLRYILSHYSIDYEFNMSDLTMPTRKRTSTFLNVLVYFRAAFEERWKDWQQRKAQCAEEQEEVDKVKREIAKMRLALDELAYKKGQSMSVDQLKEALQAERRAFEVEKKECDQLAQEAAQIKETIKSLSQKKQDKLIEVQEIEGRIKEIQKEKELNEEGAQLEERLSSAERTLVESKLQISIRVKQAQNELQKKINEKTDFIQQSRMNAERLKGEIEDIRKRRAEISARQKSRSGRFKEHIDRANKKLDDVKALYESSRTETERGKSELYNYETKLESLLGGNKSILNDTAKNRTFIKSTA